MKRLLIAAFLSLPLAGCASEPTAPAHAPRPENGREAVSYVVIYVDGMT